MVEHPTMGRTTRTRWRSPSRRRGSGAYAAISKTGDKAACVYFGYGQESLPGAFTPVAPPPIKGESAEEADEEEVGVAAENALLKQIDEEKLIAANGEGEAVEAE